VAWVDVTSLFDEVTHVVPDEASETVVKMRDGN